MVGQVGLLLSYALLLFVSVWPTLEAYQVVNNITTAQQCVAQNYAELATNRCLGKLQGSSQQFADMFDNNVVSVVISCMSSEFYVGSGRLHGKVWGRIRLTILQLKQSTRTVCQQ